MPDLPWNALGIVTSLAPVEVRFYGDTADTPVKVGGEDLTLAEGDKVLLTRVNRTQWVITQILVDL